MFKKIIFACIGILISMSAMAQVAVNRGDYRPNQYNESSFNEVKNVSKPVLKFGIKAGMNLTTMSNKMDFQPGFGIGIGFRAGIAFNVRWGQRTENSKPGTGTWGFQPEVIYSNMGVKTSAGTMRMNAVSVPLLLKIYPSTGFSLEVGPEFSYLFSTSPSVMALDGTEISVGDIKGANAGLAVGLAYDFDLGFTVGARYTYVFNDMAKNLQWKHSNIQVTVGWMF